MTSTITTRASDDRLHPDWCDFEASCTETESRNVSHYGRRTTWHPTCDDRRVSIALVHGEDQVKGDPVDHGDRWIDISITPGPDDPDISVALYAGDARFLAEQLNVYADKLDHEPGWMTREHLGMTAGEYAIKVLGYGTKGDEGSCGGVVAMSIRQAAAATSLTEEVVRDAIHAGKLKSHVVHKRIVILTEDLHSWVAGHRLVDVAS